jgi:catechol 2,3-dioxygenase-like lactoylglutathione lyase family enzyme
MTDYSAEGTFAGFHHVQLSVPPEAEEACRQFWGVILGLTELAKPPVLAARGGCWFRGGGIEVHLGVEEGFRPAAKAHPGILIRNLDALAVRLERHDVHVEWDANFPGMRRFYANDPFGNRIEFLAPE